MFVGVSLSGAAGRMWSGLGASFALFPSIILISLKDVALIKDV